MAKASSHCQVGMAAAESRQGQQVTISFGFNHDAWSHQRCVATLPGTLSPHMHSKVRVVPFLTDWGTFLTFGNEGDDV